MVERTASVDPGRGELPIAQEQSEPAQSGPRQKVHLNTADIFPVFTEIEHLVTIELSDHDGHTEPLQILFSRHDYEEGYTDPLDLQVSDTGTTIREHLQRRWGDPLPAYESQ